MTRNNDFMEGSEEERYKEIEKKFVQDISDAKVLQLEEAAELKRNYHDTLMEMEGNQEEQNLLKKEYEFGLDETKDRLNVRTEDIMRDRLQALLGQSYDAGIGRDEKLLEEAKKTGIPERIEKAEKDLDISIAKKDENERYLDALFDERKDYMQNIANENERYHQELLDFERNHDGMGQLQSIEKEHQFNLEELADQTLIRRQEILGTHQANMTEIDGKVPSLDDLKRDPDLGNESIEGLGLNKGQPERISKGFGINQNDKVKGTTIKETEKRTIPEKSDQAKEMKSPARTPKTIPQKIKENTKDRTSLNSIQSVGDEMKDKSEKSSTTQFVEDAISKAKKVMRKTAAKNIKQIDITPDTQER